MKHTGSCLCGEIRFETSGALRPVIYCHCTQCRRQCGHFMAATDVDDKELSIDGEARWYRASPSARRGFCPNCGSLLFWKADSSTRTSITAGAFDRPSGLVAASHIYCDDKGDYYTITDGLKQHPQGS